jgi:hypothetical protein
MDNEKTASGLTIRYSGPSMNPTFFTHDILTYLPGSLASLRRGDVILFRSSDDYSGEKIVIHRIIAIRKEGIVTRGDNSDRADPLLVTPGNLVGIVVSAKRTGKDIPVRSGSSGNLHHHYLFIRRRLVRGIWPVLTKLGVRLDGRYSPGCLMKGLTRGKIIGIRTCEGIDLQLYIAGFLAGWLSHDDPKWHIRPFFRPFVDPQLLPAGPGEVFSSGEINGRNGG